jgi:two-component system response regulator (stage 0 sporulation protein A)
MNKLRVLIVEDNKDACEILQKLISIQNDMEVVGIANDGKEALRLLMETEPDITLLDIIIPEMDGLEVLRKIKKIKQSKVMVISSARQDKIKKEALTLGANYYMIKPINFAKTIRRIRKLVNFQYENTTATETNIILSVKLNNLFHKLGIPNHLKGCTFLQEAIIRLIEKEILDFEIKDIYSYISKQHGISQNKVRRDIQNAIKVTWNKGEKEVLSKYFINEPSNKEFITTIAEIIMDPKDQ